MVKYEQNGGIIPPVYPKGVMPMPDDYAAMGRQFGGLGFKDASKAVEEAAVEAKRTAEKAGKLIDLATEMLSQFKRRFAWLFKT